MQGRETKSAEGKIMAAWGTALSGGGFRQCLPGSATLDRDLRKGDGQGKT